MNGLGKLASVYVTRLEGKPVGAGIVLDNRPSLDIPWASSLRAYNSLCVNHALYWKILENACRDGYGSFHFGRSTLGSGQHRFKKQWGAVGLPLNWWVYSQQLREATQHNPAAVKEKFGMAQRAWTKLPLWVSRRLGPYLIRHAP